MAMPNVSLVGDVGADLNIQEASFEVADSSVLEKFTEVSALCSTIHVHRKG